MEEFVNLKGYEGIYKINQLGQIINNDSKIMKPKPDKDGYLRIGLTKNGKQSYHYIHRLVANTFLEKPLNKPFVNHKNGVRNDNRLENLEWCTISENSLKSGINRRNTSGCKGVTFRKEKNKFEAQIKVNGKSIYLGLYTTAEEANNARIKFELEFLGYRCQFSIEPIINAITINTVE